MEFVDGPTLEAEIARRGRLPTSEALEIVLGVAEGLAYAHEHGVIHRDVKPANILLTPSGEPKVSDFGVAKLMSTEAAQTTMAVGTPSYMAPEQIEGKALDARTDVFGLAVLAYELLTGQRPFAAENLPALLYRIMHTDPPPASTLNRELPASVDPVFDRALSKDASKRTSDARKFATELREAFAAPEQTAIMAMPRRPGEAEPPFVESGFGRREEKKESSRRGRQAAIGLLLLAAFGGLIAYYLRGTPPEPKPPSVVPTPTESPTPAPSPTRTISVLPPPVVVPTVTATATSTATPSPLQPTMTPTEEEEAEPTFTPTARPRPTRTRVPTAEPRIPPAEEPTAEPEPPVPPSGGFQVIHTVIEIISEPAGAEVLVNGISKGKTPARITDLQPGTYEIEVRKEGYSSYHKTARFEANSEYTIRVTLGSAGLSAQRGYVIVESDPPGASIKINGEDSGQTPATIGLSSGHYVVSVEVRSYPPQQQTIDVKAGETHRLRFMFDVRR